MGSKILRWFRPNLGSYNDGGDHMLHKYARVKAPATHYDSKIGLIVASKEEILAKGDEKEFSYRILINGQIGVWLSSSCLEVLDVAAD